MKEITKPYQEWESNHQEVMIEVFASQLGVSDKPVLAQCFNLSNPTITLIILDSGKKELRIEEEGSEALRVVLKNYL